MLNGNNFFTELIKAFVELIKVLDKISPENMKKISTFGSYIIMFGGSALLVLETGIRVHFIATPKELITVLICSLIYILVVFGIGILLFIIDKHVLCPYTPNS